MISKTRINIFARIKSLEEQIKDLEEQVSDFDRRLEALGWRFDARQREFEGEVCNRISDGRIACLIQDFWNDHVLVQVIKDRYVAMLKTEGQNNETTK